MTGSDTARGACPCWSSWPSRDLGVIAELRLVLGPGMTA